LNSIRHILFTVLFLGLSFAQDGFDNVDESTGWSYNNSGLRAYVFVSSILVDGVPSNPDNVIGAFRRTESDSLICVGFNSTNINGETILIIWGDDGSPSTSQYLQDGDVPEFKFYNSLTGVIVPMTYNDDIDLTYVNNQSFQDWLFT